MTSIKPSDGFKQMSLVCVSVPSKNARRNRVSNRKVLGIPFAIKMPPPSAPPPPRESRTLLEVELEN